MREMNGKYKILKLPGEGATGSVYLADDPSVRPLHALHAQEIGIV